TTNLQRDNKMAWLEKPIKGLLLDISGVLKNGDLAIEGSVEAFRRLKASKIPFRLCTNETQEPREALRAKLSRLQFDVDLDKIFAPAPAMAARLRQEKRIPHLLIHPKINCEFDQPPNGVEPDCVVIGDACEAFTYEAMNTAFNILLKLKQKGEPKFYTLGRGKYYMEPNGLMLDLGPFTAALEYASGLTAELIGKPSPRFFKSALDSLELPPDQVVMIGDDIVGDVGGAQGVGLRGVLVRTGKFQPSDENHEKVKPDAIVDNFSQAIDQILQKCCYSCKSQRFDDRVPKK
ncbi:unnamed protein product, partial [Allacma fusca]